MARKKTAPIEESEQPREVEHEPLEVDGAVPREENSAALSQEEAAVQSTAETPEEGRALFGVLVQQKTLEAAAGAAGISPRKLSRLRKKFLEQMPL